MSKDDGFEIKIEIGDAYSPVSEGKIDNPWETPYERQREEISRPPLGGETELQKIPVRQEQDREDRERSRRQEEFNNVNQKPAAPQDLPRLEKSSGGLKWSIVGFVEPPRPKKGGPA